MRNLLLATFIVFFSACGNTPEEVTVDMIHFPDENSDADMPEIKFEEEVFDFGRVAEGELVDHTYIFENTGDAPLVLTAVETTCGCTAAKTWPKEPIAPGEKGRIDIQFNSDKRIGTQNKSITVVANTRPAKTVLALRGEVVGPDKPE
jgi:hypothetical protein